MGMGIKRSLFMAKNSVLQMLGAMINFFQDRAVAALALTFDTIYNFQAVRCHMEAANL
jgi:hypothetical protein